MSQIKSNVTQDQFMKTKEYIEELKDLVSRLQKDNLEKENLIEEYKKKYDELLNQIHAGNYEENDQEVSLIFLI